MRYRVFFLFFAMIFFTIHEGHAQTPDLALRYFQAGEKSMQESDWLSAAEDFTKAIIVNAKFKVQGLSKQSNKAFDTSQSETNEISVCDPFTASAYTNRGLARLQLGDLDLAIADYDRALRIQPKLIEAWMGRGIARNAKGDHGGAVLDYNHAISIDSNRAEAYVNRGIALVMEKEFAGADNDFDRALKLQPNFAWVHFWRGTSLMKQGKYEQAASSFTAALTLDPGMAEAYANRGLTFVVLGKESQALTDLKKCLDLKPDLKSDLEERTELAKKIMRLDVATLLSQQGRQ